MQIEVKITDSESCVPGQEIVHVADSIHLVQIDLQWLECEHGFAIELVGVSLLLSDAGTGRLPRG